MLLFDTSGGDDFDSDDMPTDLVFYTGSTWT